MSQNPQHKKVVRAENEHNPHNQPHSTLLDLRSDLLSSSSQSSRRGRSPVHSGGGAGGGTRDHLSDSELDTASGLAEIQAKLQQTRSRLSAAEADSQAEAVLHHMLLTIVANFEQLLALVKTRQRDTNLGVFFADGGG